MPHVGPADATLLTARVVLPAADAEPLSPGFLRWTDGTITEVGEGSPLPLPGERHVARPEGLVLPGLINTHHHLAGTATDGLLDEQGISIGSRRSGAGLRMTEAVDARTAEATALLAAVRMLRSGITTTTDSHAAWRGSDRVDGSIAAAERSGLRVLLHVAFLDRTELIPRGRQFSVDGALEELTRLRGLVSGGLVEVEPEALSLPRASDELIVALHGVRRRTMAMHLNYSRQFQDWCLDTLGHGAVEHLQQLGVLDAGWLLAHPVHLTEAEPGLIAAAGAGVSYCPVSNLSLALETPDLRPLRTAGGRIGLGLDHPNGSSDLMATARTAVLLQRSRDGDVASWTAGDALDLATRGGAAAIGRDAELGRLSVGRAADLQVLHLDDPALATYDRMPQRIALAAHPGTVSDVAVAGSWRISEGRLLHLDEAAVIDEAREARARLVRLARDGSPTTRPSADEA